jgi:hypothetical protein
MTYQRLGQKQKALATYRHGTERMQESYPLDPARLVVRDAAAKVLGIRGAEKALSPTT